MLKFIISLIVSCVCLFASDIANIKSLKGNAIIKRDNTEIVANLNKNLKQNDLIITKDKSSLGIVFYDGTIITLGENSIFSINQYLFNPTKKKFSFDFKLHKGTSSFESGKIGKLSPQSVKFRIPDGIIGIRGTRFYVEVKN